MIYRIDFSSTAQFPVREGGHRLYSREFHSPGNFFQSAEADIVCIAANSIRPVSYICPVT